MKPWVTAIERAFEIAVSGKAHSVTDIRRTLRHEGYDERHLEGRSIVDQLRTLMHDAGSKQTG